MNALRGYLLTGALWSCFAIPSSVFSQDEFYDIDSIQEIRIYFSEGNWDQILDSFFVADQEERLSGTVVINGTVLNGCGIRYKGYSSVSVNRVKNPFNIDLDFTNAAQNYMGYDKVKLSNVIQDPSFVRETLGFDIARKYMPASLANYASVYVNDTLLGLYTNVESVSREFLLDHFNSESNSFFKGNPAVLDFGGENSNLGNSHGTDPDNYKPYYELKSASGWDDLYELIVALNEDTGNIESILNVDRALWMHAFNYSLVNFDSYIGYAQNYYLYMDDNGRFNTIPWDLNMSFASYRLSDASDFWSGFSVEEAKTIDPLAHHNSISVNPRPMMRNLFSNSTWRKQYIAHLRTIIDENFVNGEFKTRGQYLQALIDSDVQNDANKFYSYADFLTNLDTTVTDLIEYPGIGDLMDDRVAFLNGYPGFRANPVIDSIGNFPLSPVTGEMVFITANVSEADTAWLAYRFSSHALYSKTAMYDDGMHNDSSAGDGMYGAEVRFSGNKLQYYIYAENDSAGMFSPERAEFEFHSLEAPIAFPQLVINEFMANNAIMNPDADGDFEDWIEIRNNTDFDLSTGGLYLSDSSGDLLKWELPDVIVNSGGYTIIWADGETNQEGMHANFELSDTGGVLVLSHSGGGIVDSVAYGQQWNITSYGRHPNGTGDWRELIPTFGSANVLTEDGVIADDFFIWPNPASDILQIKVNSSLAFQVEIFNSGGFRMLREDNPPPDGVIPVNTSGYAAGLYLIRFMENEKPGILKFIINH